jgi:hypothetical protein
MNLMARMSLLGAGVFLLASPSEAGVFIDVSGTPIINKSNRSIYPDRGGSFDSAVAVSTESGIGYDLRTTGGFAIWDKLLIGATVNFASSPLKRDAIEGGAEALDKNTKTSEWGPTLGYLNGGFRLFATALVLGKKITQEKRTASDGTVNQDAEYNDKLGLGYQITLGYAFSIGKRFRLGPSLIYRQVNYRSESATDSADPSNPLKNYDQAYATRWTEGSITPMVSLSFGF